MRGLRWLILIAIGALIAFVAVTYQQRSDDQTHAAPKTTATIPDGVNIQSEEWTFTQSEKGREKARMRAKNFRQLKESSKIELEGVTLEIPHKDGKHYDRIKTQRAEFDQKAETLFADGEVEIFMDVPKDEEPSGKLIKITTSGVTFEKSGRAQTDREVSFDFDRGSGKSTGAFYDTSLRELHLAKKVELIWKGTAKDAIPMHIESDSAIYRESEAIVYLLPWAKMRRGGLTMDAGGTVVKLKEGRIDVVETQKAKGVQEVPGVRKLEFGADSLVINFVANGQVSKITGDTNATLDSVTRTSKTSVTSDKVILDFEPGKDDSALTKAYAAGKSVLTSTPLVAVGETRIVKSEVVEIFMRAGGEEIDRAETAAPSSLELIPNRATQPHRWLTGDRFLIAYGKENQIDHFDTTGATTRTQPPTKANAKKAEPLIVTTSRKLNAEFDAKTGQLAKLHQNENFEYEAGDRKARASKADLDQATDVIVLTGAARVWDLSGSTTGDTVRINQKSGEFVAEGSVTSTRLPDKKPGKATTANVGMMSHEDATQATARKMTSANNNKLIRYEGNAVTWQGSNRVTADHIEIDRENEVLRANGNVVSQFADRAEDKKDDKKKSKAKPKSAASTATVFTIVKAPELIYTEADRMAHYRQGALLTRPGLVVKGQQIRAYLNDSSEESSLSRVVVDGDVEIVQSQTTPQKRTRTGTSEHADYYPDEDKVSLLGGKPLLIDSVKGKTEGRELTYFSGSEKLIVDGVEQKPTESVIKRKAAAKSN